VHSAQQLLNDAYPNKFRRLVEQKVRDRGAEIVFSDYVDVFPELGQTADITTRKGRTLKNVDLVISSFGSRPNTSFISSLGSGVLTSSGTVKVKPTLELLSHPGVFAAGDIIDWSEQKQGAKAGKHASIVTANVLNFLKGEQQGKVYKGQPELIVIPVGKQYGAGYLGLLWGITFGNFFTSLLKGRTLLVPMARSGLNYK